jgi:hypothetical protein
MNVVKYGKLPPPLKFHGTCHYCHTIVEVNNTDKEFTYVEGTSHPKVYKVKCPTDGCPRDIELIRGKYPKPLES